MLELTEAVLNFLSVLAEVFAIAKKKIKTTDELIVPMYIMNSNIFLASATCTQNGRTVIKLCCEVGDRGNNIQVIQVTIRSERLLSFVQVLTTVYKS